MKSNFFKIVLPAFALMLAITASLAFTSADSAETATEIIVAEYIHPDTGFCTFIYEVSCQLQFIDIEQAICTVIVQDNEGVDVLVDLHLLTNFPTINCTIPLYEYIPE
ncbi:DUF6520 family protein [Flavivirga aquimarina]|uniref:DUF6520 family protein n=1 Tax=Flavivirga aquimarina TaxID=2027862 RepID=A0ABT8W5Z7_9FLAO|nr:DUF6520 family protein [Flavivirga aquimarina]MDO5968531.1 DUF6520 family protein [Flavivirga aquimarina]